MVQLRPSLMPLLLVAAVGRSFYSSGVIGSIDYSMLFYHHLCRTHLCGEGRRHCEVIIMVKSRGGQCGKQEKCECESLMNDRTSVRKQC